MTWMNLPQEFVQGKFVVLPIEYEHNVTYGKGASLGSSAIINASIWLGSFLNRASV